MKKYTILFLFLLLSGCATISKNLEVDVNDDFPHNEVQKIAIVTFETSLEKEGTTGLIFKSSSVEKVKTVFTGIMARELRRWERFAILEGKTLEEELPNKQPSKRKVESSTYIRDHRVKEYARLRANGKCQLCEQNAPFKSKDGKMFYKEQLIGNQGYWSLKD